MKSLRSDNIHKKIQVSPKKGKFSLTTYSAGSEVVKMKSLHSDIKVVTS